MAENYLWLCRSGHQEQYTAGMHGFRDLCFVSVKVAAQLWTKQDACTHTHPQQPQVVKKDELSHSHDSGSCVRSNHVTITKSSSQNISKPWKLQYYRVYGNNRGFFHMCHWCGFSVNTLKEPTNNHWCNGRGYFQLLRVSGVFTPVCTSS